MKILQVTRGNGKLLPEENPSSVESVIFNISRCLANMNHDITIIDRKFDKLPIEYINGSKIVRLDINNFESITGKNRLFDLISSELAFISFALGVRKYIKENDFDIIHVHSTMVGLSLSIFNKNVTQKMIYTSHMSVWSLPEYSMNFLEKSLKFLDSVLMKKVSKVIALGQNLKLKYVSKGVDPKKIFVAYNGVDTNLFNPISINIKNPGNWTNNGKFNILFVGRIDKIKGIIYLVRAMNVIVNRYKYNNVQCLVVGPTNIISVDSNEDTGAIFKYIEDNNLKNNIIFLGELSIDDLKNVYNISDTFILPSLAEAAPLTILEAMAFGKPVICSNVGAISEYISDKFNGFLVEPKNEIQLAEKIKYMFDNPDQKKLMGDNSLKLANNFDWNKVTIGIESIYKSSSSYKNKMRNVYD